MALPGATGGPHLLKVLDAAALAEKPFLDTGGANSVDLGLRNVSFTYHYLFILLTRYSSERRAQCIESSKRTLHLLDKMISDTEESYNGVVWQIICGSSTPFLTLFGEMISNAKGGTQENKDTLAAMEQLPTYLSKMG